MPQPFLAGIYSGPRWRNGRQKLQRCARAGRSPPRRGRISLTSGLLLGSRRGEERTVRSLSRRPSALLGERLRGVRNLSLGPMAVGSLPRCAEIRGRRLLEEQTRTRLPELVPIRYGRMLVSPFTFFRGAAYLMAADALHNGQRTGFKMTQLCGDAHLSNFGVFRCSRQEARLQHLSPGKPPAWPRPIPGASLALPPAPGRGHKRAQTPARLLARRQGWPPPASAV